MGLQIRSIDSLFLMKYLILDNIRSTHNVGSIFRTADGAGVKKIFLCGYTPSPVDRFNRPVPAILKTSLGATETVEWEADSDVVSVVCRLKEQGFLIVSVEQTEQSISFHSFTSPEKVAFILGNEIDGVQPAVLSASDVVIDIPMNGKKESLNVSVAAGIVLFCC